MVDKSCLSEQINHTLASLNELISPPEQEAITKSDLLVMHACIHTPWTRKQHQDWTRYWPMSFYGGNRERQAQLTPAQTIISLVHINSLSSSFESSGCFGREKVDAFLVDPKTNSILFKSSQSHNHPLDHASMTLINSLASQIQTTQAASLTKRKTKNDQYYCTGLHLYISHEPCMMCAMALVHSRIGMVFYKREDCLYGALGSAYKVHICESLNHHFQVFKMER